jgi:hypothetical protein
MIGINLLPIVENFSQKGVEFNMKETITVLSYNKKLFWSWKVKKAINYKNKVLILSVNGRYHKGKILIRLNGLNLYDVMFVTTQNKIKKEITDIYDNIFSEIIDNCIESNPRGFEMYT